MNESQDLKPHVHVPTGSHPADDAVAPGRGEAISIWFFCGILTLVYGVVLVLTALSEHFGLFGMHNPTTVLANLHPTFWWGSFMLLFGLFYTVKFRPGKA
jgi:hypothetical protein